MSIISAIKNWFGKIQAEWSPRFEHAELSYPPVGLPQRLAKPQSPCPPDLTQELTTKGWKISIRHLRFFPNYKDENGESYYTRFGFDRKYPGIGNTEGLAVSQYNSRVATTGGRTEVVLTAPDGRVFSGKAECSLQDNFSRREGRSRAVYRAYEEYLKTPFNV